MTAYQYTSEPVRLGAEYHLLSQSISARADLPLFLRVSVRNTGAAPWPNQGAHAVNLSYHWQAPDGRMIEFNGLRAMLPAPVRTGETSQLELQVEPPERPGDYLLALDMVEEGIGWFSLCGVAPLTIALTVAAVPAGMPRVCIVNGNCMINDAVGNHVINQLRFFLARGYQPLVLLETLDMRQPAELRQFFVPISLDQLRREQATPQTRRAIAHFQAADLYVFNYSTYYPLAEAIELVGRGAVVLDYHGVTPPELWEGAGIEDLILGQQHIRLVRYADYAIAHSQFTRAELLASGAISPERVFVNPLVVPLERFRPGSRDAELLARYGLVADQPVLLYVGRMAGNKRIEDLVRALAHIRAQLPQAALLLVGACLEPYTAYVERVRQLATTLGVSDGVIFTGQVPDDELLAHYQLADVYVTASLHEGFCVPVVEALACGVPVVGTQAAALPETIGSAGLTFRPQDPADLADKVLAILAGRADMNYQHTEEIVDVADIG